MLNHLACVKTALGADTLKIGQGKAFAKKWVRKHPSQPNFLARVPGVDAITDETANDLKQVQEKGTLSDNAKITELRKRKLIIQRWAVFFCSTSQHESLC